MLGEGARAVIANMIRNRFNMDGNDPEGRKVGLLDRHHLFCYIVDPFNWVWRSRFELPCSMAQLVNEMIASFVPLDGDGSSTSRDHVRADFMVRSYNTCSA